jgi:hypothetical protein
MTSSRRDSASNFVEVCSLAVAIAGLSLAIAEHNNNGPKRGYEPPALKMPNATGDGAPKRTGEPPAVSAPDKPRDAVPLNEPFHELQRQPGQLRRPQSKTRPPRSPAGWHGGRYRYPSLNTFDYPIIEDFR